jgi:dihydroorotase (multifunctional complex type)
MSRRPAATVVRSRRIHTPSGWRDGSIVIGPDGRVIGIAEPGDEPPAARRIDATDLVVLPGLVDTHAHFRDPGFTAKEDYLSGTRAAAAGGVTTVLDMPNVEPPTTTADRLTAHLANAAARAIVDFGHNAAATVPEEIPGLAEAGAAAFKVFMMRDVGRTYPHMPGIAVDDHATLLRICEAVARTGRPLFVHPWDQSLYELFVARAQERWGRDFRSYARAGREADGLVLDSGVATMLQLQRATGVRLHVLHVMSSGTIGLIRAAKAAGRTVTAEVNPGSLFVADSWDRIERLGPYALGMWVPDDHAAALWSATIDGTIDVVGTDHAPHTRAEKELGWRDMYAAPGGAPMIEHYLSLLLTDVAGGRLSLDRVVELCSAAPARLVGLYPRKGAIRRGSDADLVVIDPDRQAVIRAATSHSKCGWTNLEGRAVVGLPVMTILRGTVVAAEGEILVGPGFGRPVVEPGAGVPPRSRAEVGRCA